MEILVDSFSNRLTKALQIRNMKPIELAEKSGIDKGKISSYMSGRYKAKQDTLYILATALDVSPVWLMGYDVSIDGKILDDSKHIKLSDEDISFMNGIKKLDENEKKIIRNTMDYLMGVNTVYQRNNTFMCPVYGQISAGQPNWAEECLEGYLPIDPNLMGIINPEECFFLRINGESMNQLIRNGAYALIRKQDTVENGEIAAVLVNGFDATLKKFTQQGDLIILEPCSDDSSFKTQAYTAETQIRILGKYIGKFEMN